MRGCLWLFTALALSLVSGCGCETGSHGPRRDTGTRDGGGSGEDSNVDTGSIGNPVDANRPDMGFMSCDGLDFDAQQGNRPIDIVWVIDNSGSMDQEATLVQSGLNDFGARISASGITNYHVIVMTQMGWVTVPPPLGTDPSHFLFVDQDVQSHDAFQRAIQRLPDFRSFLRPDSVMHFIFVTDDESDMPASTFLAMMQGTLGRDDFVAHVIVSPPGSMHREVFLNVPGCDGPYGQGAANGQRYWDIAGITGGLQLDICSGDWGVIFDQLLTAVAVPMPIPCRFAIPEPPAGMTFDSNRVNVVYTPGGGGGAETIPRSDCSSGVGWHYDDPSAPTEILLCPDTCARVDGDDTGHVQIQLGCQTILM
jgi:hypothetical protein